MAIDESKVEAIYFAALDKQSPEDRVAYLDEACAKDASLRLRVEALLSAQPNLGHFLEGHAAEMVTMTSAPIPSERPGTQIGPYKLLQQIGEGGMGTVFMAEQHEPVKRRVALKVIKLGMDTRQVIARFEAERQALTLMDHPNIAKVLDAGSTDSGRPYFVMELVKGQPITQYCDEHRLTPRQRLELLIPVCQAIQHAHQKGIIHRDIKPTNILVAEYDEQPVPKVIDFGVAKATSQSLTEKTMFTGLGQIVGTLEYMSPEQAKVNQLDIDTRSDIYSLGVLLYELLTGSTPFDRKRLHSAAFDEMLRIIREEEPPKPSTRLSDSHDSLPSVSAQRHTEPAKLTKLVRGELDWIVMKALEKDRSRRYETAVGFAADLERYLTNEPVQACPPSAAYRVRKFMKRNRAQVIAGGIVAGAMVLGLIGTSIGMAWALTEKTKATRAAKAEAAAKVSAQENEQKAVASAQVAEASKEEEAKARKHAETITEFVITALKASDAYAAGAAAGPGGATAPAYDMTILGAMDNAIADLDSGRFKDDPQTEAGIRQTIGLILLNNGKYDKARLLLEQVLEMRERLFNEDDTIVAASMSNLARVYADQAQFDKAEPLLVRALAIYEKALGPEHSSVASILGNLGRVYWLKNEYAQAKPLYERALAIREKALGPEHQDVAISLNRLAELYSRLGQHAEAALMRARALAILEQALGPEHPAVAANLSGLARIYLSQGLYSQAEPLLVRALAINERAFGPDHQSVASSLRELAGLYYRQWQYAQAEPLFKRALAITEKAMGPDHPEVATYLNDLAMLYKDQSQYAQAEPLFTRALAIYESALGPDRANVAATLNNLAALYRDQGHFDRAEPLVTRALAICEKSLGPNNTDVAATLDTLARVYLEQSRYAQAEPLFTRALAIKEMALGSDHPQVSNSLANLALVYSRQAHYDKAEPLMKRALAISEKARGPDHPDVAQNLFNLADLCILQRQYAEAETFAARALEISRKSLGQGDQLIAFSLNNLARARQSLGKTVEARRDFDEAVTIFRRLQPEGSPIFARILWRSASARLDNQDAAAALPELEEAVAMAEKFLKPEHPYLTEYRETLAKCRAALAR